MLEIYWQQVRPFDGHELRQSTQPRARILIATDALRQHFAVGPQGGLCRWISPRSVFPRRTRRAIDDITLCLAQQPLHRCRNCRAHRRVIPFSYDDSFLHDQVTRSTLRARGDAIELKPGVAHGLARLAGLLKPALEIMWVDDVRRMNKFLDAKVPDVAGRLFGRERTAVAAVRGPFKEAFGPHCFYCGTHLPANNPIDHVLPWSLVGIDGLSNLVLSCARCNGDKSGALPAVRIVDRVLERERDVLEEIASERCSSLHSMTVSSRPPGGSIAGNRRACQPGRDIGKASGWTSAFRLGGLDAGQPPAPEMS